MKKFGLSLLGLIAIAAIAWFIFAPAQFEKQTNMIDGEPLLMFSFSSHRILIFGLELSWYDLQLLGGLLIAGATFLFFLSMLAGRV